MFDRRNQLLPAYGSQQRGEQDRGTRRENPGEEDDESSYHQKLPEVVSYLHTRHPSFDLDLTCLYPPLATCMRAGPKPGCGLSCFDPDAFYLIALALPGRLVCPSSLLARCRVVVYEPYLLQCGLIQRTTDDGVGLALQEAGLLRYGGNDFGDPRYLTGVFNWLCVAGMKP